MTHNSQRYTIYLLTVWFDEGQNANDPASWRFRLENPRTKEAKGFVGLTMLGQGLTEVIRQEKVAQRQNQDDDESAVD